MSISITSAVIGAIFNGSYEQTSIGYGGSGVVYNSGGSASSTTLAGYTVYMVGTNAGNPWWGGGGAFSTVLLLLMEPSTPTNFADSITITDPDNNVYTYDLSAATTFTLPPDGGAITSFQGFYWNVQSASEFVNGEVTVIDAVLPPGISIAPTSVTMNYGANELFIATTTNPSGAPVTWSCLYGTVDVAGFYVAPPQSSGKTSDTVTAALTNDPSTTADADVTLTPALIAVPAGLRLPVVYSPTVFTKAATINPKIYMPVEDTTVVAK